MRRRNCDVSLHGDERRGLLHCVLDMPDSRRELHAVCVHLGLRDTHRRRQLGLLCDLLHEGVTADAPVIVAGDFNDWHKRGHRLLGACGLKGRSEEHTSELQSLMRISYAVFCLKKITYKLARTFTSCKK